MRRLTTRFALFIATAAVLPLVGYGFVAIGSLWRGTRESVRTGHLNVATRAAGQIRLYVDNAIGTLRSIGSELRGTQLAKWQQERILRNHVLDFPELREITLFDGDGAVVATSRLGEPGVTLPAPDSVGPDGVAISPLTIDDDLLPAVTLAVRAAEGGWLVADASLEQLWRMVDSIRIGQRGYAMLVTPDNRLIAHGDPAEKRRVARGEGVEDAALLELLRDRRNPWRSFEDPQGRDMLATAAVVDPIGWTLIVEQPAQEAYAVAFRLENQLTIAIVLALLAMVLVGYLWGRAFLARIFELMRGTRAIAEGRMTARVRVRGRDEIRQLGDAFNTMADRLVELQDNLRRQERQAMFGRIVQGLVHDLSNPIMNIGNNCKLIVRLWGDAEYRETFKNLVDRELGIISQMLADLRNIAKPQQLARHAIEVNRSVGDVVESMRAQAEGAKVALRADKAPHPLYIEGDSTALARVYRNLVQNAIEATPPGGLVVVRTEAAGDLVRVGVADTGCGIARERFATIFDDFVTTKRNGLGLGLATTKKIVEQIGGTVTVTSEVGRGTTFVLEFPATDARPMPEAAVG